MQSYPYNLEQTVKQTGSKVLILFFSEHLRTYSLLKVLFVQFCYSKAKIGQVLYFYIYIH